MLKTQEIDEELFKYFSTLRYYIENSNKNGHFDINTYCEDFFNDLLNLLFDLQLINLNQIQNNYPAIDLGDMKSRICYQVTTTNSIKKIKTTLEKFKEKELYKKYDSINILILGEKTKHKKPLIFKEFKFSYEDNLIDLQDILKRICELKDIQKKEQIVQVIKKELMEIKENKKNLLSYKLLKPTEFFMGRDNEISKIAENFSEGKNIVFIKGIGGIGKSEIAKAYSIKYKDNYDTISFVRYNSDLENTIASLEFNNFILEVDGKLESIYRKKLKELKCYDKKTLIIIDNFNFSIKIQPDDNKELVAQKEKEQKIFNEIISGEYHILFTTRNYFENFTKSTIDVQSISDKNVLRKLFFSYCEKQETDELVKVVDEIIKLVNGHTLTLELIAKMTQNSRRNINDILEVLRVEGLRNSIKTQVTSNKDDINIENLMYIHIKSLFSFHNISKKEKEILINLCLVDYSGIECTEFLKWINSEDDFTAINNLIKSGWILESDKIISLHPVISEVVYRELEPNIEKCINFLNNFAQCIMDKDINPIKANTYTNIAVFVYKRIKDIRLDLINLYQVIETFFRNQSLLKESLEICLKIVQIWKENNGVDSDIIAQVYTDTGLAYDLLGLNKNAYDYYAYALEIRKKLSGQQNKQSIAYLYHNISGHYMDLGEYDDAMRYCDDSIEVQKTLLSENPLDIADCYEVKAMIYKIHGDFDNALKYEFEALSIKKNMLDKDSLGIARAQNNIGSIYCEMNEHEKALVYYLDVVEVFEEKCVYNHVFVANIYNNIGTSYQYLKKYEEAERFLTKALEIKSEIFDSNSIEIAMLYDSLGANYFYTGNLDKSLEYRLKADEIIQSVDANETNITITIYSNIGVTYWQKCDFANAIKYQLRALKISEKIFGSDSVNTIIEYGKLGYYLESSNPEKIKFFLKYINGIETIVKKVRDQDKDLFYNACVCVSNYYFELGDKGRAKIYVEKPLKYNRSFALRSIF